MNVLLFFFGVMCGAMIYSRTAGRRQLREAKKILAEALRHNSEAQRHLQDTKGALARAEVIEKRLAAFAK